MLNSRDSVAKRKTLADAIVEGFPILRTRKGSRPFDVDRHIDVAPRSSS